MSAVIGSARVDERGTYKGGTAGDQKQKSAPDYSGEVSRQAFYVHSKGWYILRPKSVTHATKIAAAMAAACDNPNIGYSQSGRYGILSVGTGTKTATNCDCSSLVRQCVKEGTGKDSGDFHTGNEAAKLTATGLFDKLTYTKGDALYAGDILVTKTKGHTVIVIEGDGAKKPISEIAREVLDGKWGNGIDRKNRLHAAGYDYAEVQAEVNRILKAEKPAQHVDQKGLALIKQFEGCRLKAYKLAGEKYYTIGYGHYGADVLPNMTISQECAEEMLKADLVKYENYVKKYAANIVLTQNRLNALTSYTYNRGAGGMKELAAASDSVESYAENIVKLWGKAMRYKDALIKRREKEREMFLS